MTKSDPIARHVGRLARPIGPASPLSSQPSAPRPTDARPGVSVAEVCWRRRWTVAGGVLLGVAAAAAYVAKAPKVYTPTATLYVNANGLQLLGNDAARSEAEVETFLARQCEVIRSEQVIRQVADASPADVRALYPASADPAADLRNGLSVAVGKKDDVITVALDARRPVEGARLVNQVIAVYQASEKRRAHATASEAEQILTDEKRKQEQALDDEQRRIVAFKQANGEMFFATDRGTNITVQNLATISDQVTKLRLYAATLRVAYLQDPGQAKFRAWQQADGDVKELERLYEQQKAEALKINAAQAEYQRLQAEVDRTTKQCDLLDMRIRELDVTQEGGPDIQVLEAAKAEPRPTSPKKALALLTALFGGAVLGCGLAVLREATDHRIRTAAQAIRVLGSPVLGVLPDVPGRGADPLALARVTRRQPDGPLAAAFHALAAEVCFGRPAHAGRSVLVTSPGRGDGKSTVAANLAVAAARAGRRTLLVDADLRNADQLRVFDAVGTLGLADVIVDGFGIDQVVRPTEVRGLSLLPAGAARGNPVAVTGSGAFGDLLRQLEDQFDLVVIDGPSVLGTGEGRVLAANADAAVLVLRADRTTRQAARLAADRIQGVGCGLLGLALNGCGTAVLAEDLDVDLRPPTTARETMARAAGGAMRLPVRTAGVSAVPLVAVGGDAGPGQLGA